MVCLIQCLAVLLAIALPTVSASIAEPWDFQESQLQDAARTAPDEIDRIVRLARSPRSGQGAGYDPSSSASSSEDERCSSLYRCWISSGLFPQMRNVFRFHFDHLTQSLPTSCPQIDNKIVACRPEDCPVALYRNIFRAGGSIAYRICTLQPEFESRAACWADPFRREMRGCFNAAPQDGTRLQNVRQCLQNAIQGLSNCTTQAQDFFNDFMTFVLDAVEEDRVARYFIR